VRDYELTIVIPSDVADDAITGVVQTVQGWIEAGAGRVTEINVWGRRHLQYQIKDYREGTYVLLRAEMQPNTLLELERELKLYTQVIRYLLVQTLK